MPAYCTQWNTQTHTHKATPTYILNTCVNNLKQHGVNREGPRQIKNSEPNPYTDNWTKQAKQFMGQPPVERSRWQSSGWTKPYCLSEKQTPPKKKPKTNQRHGRGSSGHLKNNIGRPNTSKAVGTWKQEVPATLGWGYYNLSTWGKSLGEAEGTVGM